MHNSNLQYAYELIKKKFGESFLNDFISFKERLKKRDEVIAQHIDESVENILLLDKDYAKDLLSFLKELSKTNAFAATFFIEKIPILMHFSLYDDYIEFIAQIKDYNARHISYLLGSYHLMADDLQDILDKVEITYYLSLLSEVKSRSHKLKAVAASVMINSIGIYKSVLQKDLNKYLDLCINIYSQYGFDIAELFLKNTEKVLKSLTLKEVLPTINEVYLYGENYLQLYLMFPEKLPKKLTKTSKQKNVQKKTVLSLLQKDPLKEISKHIELLDNNYLFAIIANWNTFPEEQKNQILEQLRHDDYKKFILNNKYLSNKIKKINSITKNW
ncbi:MAG TPA: hypothetical protein PLS49_07350, partial [Candidatus Woesebacteria bacterium]|nr:hypothetical protein [Candidatus Woesebacteria bacterium]